MGIKQGNLKDGQNTSFDLIQNRIEFLSSKMDTLIDIQEKVLNRLDGMENMENVRVDKEENKLPPKRVNQLMGQEVRNICQELSTIVSVVNQRSEQQAQKLEGMEKLVLSMQQVISFIGETVKSSRVMQLMLKGPAARKGFKPKDCKGKQAAKKKTSTDAVSKKADKLKDHKSKEGTEKPSLTPKSPKAQKKTKPPDTDISIKKQALLLEEVQKLNRENTEKTQAQKVEVSSQEDVSTVVYYLPDDSKLAEKQEPPESKDEEHKEEELIVQEAVEEEASVAEEEEICVCAVGPPSTSPSPPAEAETDQQTDVDSSAECVETEEHDVAEHTESQMEEREEKKQSFASEGWAVFKADGVEITLDLKQSVEEDRDKTTENNMENNGNDEGAERFFIDTTPPPTAPFIHRVVSAKPNQISNFYTINWQEVLGGGRFGQVHKCVENSSGLTLAAKVIKARSQKEKEVVKNEIQVMNNLDHASLIQLYAAYESRNDIILVLEYVGGGELFDRIIDENYKLTELDALVFIRQICEGLQHMHRMYILHLDLKPENILCVSRVTNKVKIIDFGLARIYKPREKLRVNFGTPEFLAPEVINYDFVSFNTDMWSLGVITYMLLSGLCPFLGDDDNQTLNNILTCQWNFEEREFVDTSAQAKDFISRLLIVNKSWRMSASEALRHPWLSDPVLHHHLNTKKTMCRSRRSSCVPPTDS